MMLAPIVLFVYNRPWHTEKTLMALSDNELADKSVLYIYADGPKEGVPVNQLEKIKETRKVIRKKNWCNEVHIIEQEKNKGLADSIVEGVTEIVNRYGKIIVLEDDIVTSRGFLKYMNDALNLYQNEEKVMHISGYMYPHSRQNLSSSFFYSLPSPWGWATWSRAWKYYNDDEIYLYNYFEQNKLWKEFNTAGGNYFQIQLKGNVDGNLKTWFVKWHASIMLHNKGLTLLPEHSLVYNSGFDGSGVHCGDNDSERFNKGVVNEIDIQKERIKSSNEAKKIIFDFYKSDIQYPRKTKSILYRVMRKVLRVMINRYVPELKILFNKEYNFRMLVSISNSNIIGDFVCLSEKYEINNTSIGNYSYIALGAHISNTTIGKFCSIGPNFLCGWGIHPTNGISTSPMFYSTMKQNGMTLSDSDKIEERKPISIGNDVFIGANVTVLDGVSIGDGAVIGAGAVVSKNIPPYAIAVGSPIRIIKYRFEKEKIKKFQKIEWWNFDKEKIKDVERMFFDVEDFTNKYD